MAAQPEGKKVERATTLGPFLRESFPEHDRTHQKRLLKFGSVRVNGEVVTAYHYSLRVGDRVDLLSKKEARVERTRQALRLNILYEDDVMVVTDKPAGLLTMGTELEKERTLYWHVTAYVRENSADGRGRVFIVHRIDRETSGVVVFAKSAEAKETLQKNWPKTLKVYTAVVEGPVRRDEGILRSFLVEDRDMRVSGVPRGTIGAKEAVTRYRVLKRGLEYSLLDLQIDTGRKNQIRVQLAEAGHPVAGDRKYAAATDPLGRLALHACRVELDHPVSGKRMVFVSEAPKEFVKLIQPIPEGRKDRAKR